MVARRAPGAVARAAVGRVLADLLDRSPRQVPVVLAVITRLALAVALVMLRGHSVAGEVAVTARD